METLFIPKDLEHMNLISTIVSPTVDGFGVVILGEHIRDNEGLPTIRLYLAKSNNETNIYEIEKELEAFSFLTVDAALGFVGKFPQMSALDLILAMNSFENTIS